jgi:hypothetical protein
MSRMPGMNRLTASPVRCTAGFNASTTPSDDSTETLCSIDIKASPTATVYSSAKASPAVVQISVRSNQPKGFKTRGRKGHTKSRTGCLNCKRARIKVGKLDLIVAQEDTDMPKCKENRPACDYCAHRGLRCEWPDLHITQAHNVVPLRDTAPEMIASLPANPNTPGPVFTMLDFRLFNHFVQTAYPHHPPGNDSKWTHEIPCISSDVRPLPCFELV